MDGGGRGWTKTRLDEEASGRIWWLGVGEIDAITAVSSVVFPGSNKTGRRLTVSRKVYSTA